MPDPPPPRCTARDDDAQVELSPDDLLVLGMRANETSPESAPCLPAISASTCSVAELPRAAMDEWPPAHHGWWRYTLVSAGISAALFSLGFTLAT
jgi:hypothetical protein